MNFLYHFFIFVITVLPMVGHAQTNVKIIDLYAHPVPDINSEDTIHRKIVISFKIKNISEASKVHILIGTTQGSTNTQYIIADFIYQNNSYFLSYNNTLFPVKGYETSIHLKVNSEQFQNYRYITVYVEDKNNIETQPLSTQLY